MFSSRSPTAEMRPTIAITTHRVTLSISKRRGVRGWGVRRRAFENITDPPAVDESKLVRRTIVRDMLPIPSHAVVQKASRILSRNAHGRFLVFTARTRLIGKGRKGSTAIGPAPLKYGSKPVGQITMACCREGEE
jgi:hypothetical protein